MKIKNSTPEITAAKQAIIIVEKSAEMTIIEKEYVLAGNFGGNFFGFFFGREVEDAATEALARLSSTNN